MPVKLFIFFTRKLYVKQFRGTFGEGQGWYKRGKKYRAAGLAALKELYGVANEAKEGESKDTDGRIRANPICDLVTGSRVLDRS